MESLPLFYKSTLEHISLMEREKKNMSSLIGSHPAWLFDFQREAPAVGGDAETVGRTDLTLPYPISANRYWRTGIRGRNAVTYVSDEAREYKTKVGRICADAGIEPTAQPVAVTLKLYPKDRRVLDADNCAKVAVDAMQGHAYINDKQVDELHVYKMKPDGNGARLEVSVQMINQK